MKATKMAAWVGGSATLLLFAAPSLYAASITYVGDISDGSSGVGHGTVLEVLNLAPGGSATTEAGSVRWNGTTDVYNDYPSDDPGNDATGPQGVTRTVSQLTGLTKHNMAVVFNVNEAGNPKSVVLRQFAVIFQDSSGSILGEAVFVSNPVTGQTFANTGGGQGSGDHLFKINFDDGDTFIDTWLAGPTNRVGMYVRESKSIQDVSNGAETFSFGVGKGFDPGPVIPLPASVWMGALGLLAVGLMKYRRLARA